MQWKDIEVVSHNVGFRPAREGGIRVELEQRTIGEPFSPLLPKAATSQPIRRGAVVHAYGAGGGGVSTFTFSSPSPSNPSDLMLTPTFITVASVGMAQEVGKLVDAYLSSKEKA